MCTCIYHVFVVLMENEMRPCLEAILVGDCKNQLAPDSNRWRMIDALFQWQTNTNCKFSPFHVSQSQNKYPPLFPTISLSLYSFFFLFDFLRMLHAFEAIEFVCCLLCEMQSIRWILDWFWYTSRRAHTGVTLSFLHICLLVTLPTKQLNQTNCCHLLIRFSHSTLSNIYIFRCGCWTGEVTDLFNWQFLIHATHTPFAVISDDRMMAARPASTLRSQSSRNSAGARSPVL